jgi:hypothetical protein
VIRAFSRKGELVLDPFCGGGTTLLEAMRLKRRAAGMDVSSLAAFIARTKTTPLSVHDRHAINAWLNCMADEEPAAPVVDAWGTAEEQEHYERNCPAEARVFFAWVVNKVMLLPKRRQQAFARLILISVERNASCGPGAGVEPCGLPIHDNVEINRLAVWSEELPLLAASQVGAARVMVALVKGMLYQFVQCLLHDRIAGLEL